MLRRFHIFSMKNLVYGIEPRILSLSQESLEYHAKVAAEFLNKGEVIATPTDTIYGIASLANNLKAIRKLYEIKGRDSSKPVSICVAEIEDVYNWGQVTIPKELLQALLPGPVTLCFKRQPQLNPELNPDSELVGIRIPDYPFIRAVCRETKLPLALTSANRSNGKSTLSIDEFCELNSHLSCIFDGGRLSLDEKARLGSTIVDLSNPDHYSLIRPGSAEKLTVEKLEEFGIRPLI